MVYTPVSLGPDTDDEETLVNAEVYINGEYSHPPVYTDAALCRNESFRVYYKRLHFGDIYLYGLRLAVVATCFCIAYIAARSEKVFDN